MGTRLNQLIAVSKDKKSFAKKVETKVYHTFDKTALFNGLERTYTPKDDNGDKLPAESKTVQVRVDAEISAVQSSLVEMLDTVTSLDKANCEAFANVVVDGNTVLSEVPVTSLLFLEKQLTDFAAFVSKIPVLDPAYVWNWDANANLYRTDAIEKSRTAKVEEALVLFPATVEHPAQCKTITKDVNVGTWKEIALSSAWPATKRSVLAEKVRKLQEAVVKAREEANSMLVSEVSVGKKIFDYLLA